TLVKPPARDRRTCAFGRGLRVAEVHEAIFRELRVQGDVEQPALTGARVTDVAEGIWYAFHGRGKLTLKIPDAEVAGIALRDEIPAVRKQSDAPRMVKSGRD